MDTLIQPNSRMAFVTLPDGSLKYLKGMSGTFQAFETPVRVRRTGLLTRQITVGKGERALSVVITEGLDDIAGASIWLSSFAMCAWLAAHGRAELKGKDVLELGSGVGLGGLFAEKCCTPKNLLLTDGNIGITSLTQHNIHSNNSQARAETLLWVQHSTGNTYDVILACDCVYQLNAGDFLQAVLQHLKPGGKLFLINPPEKSRAGIDDLIYKLWEHGDIKLEDASIKYGRFSKQLMFVTFTRE